MRARSPGVTLATVALCCAVFGCGSEPGDTTTIAAAPSPIPFTDSMAASGEDLRARLSLACDEWNLTEDPPPGEHYVRCQVGEDEIFWAEVVPDTTGHHAANPADLVQGLRALLAEDPQEACEHFGGGPFVAGVNWWSMGTADALAIVAHDTGGVLVPGIDCTPYEPEASPPVSIPPLSVGIPRSLGPAQLAGVGPLTAKIFVNAPDPAGTTLGCEGMPVEYLWAVNPETTERRPVVVAGEWLTANELAVHGDGLIAAIDRCESSVSSLVTYMDDVDGWFEFGDVTEAIDRPAIVAVAWATEGMSLLVILSHDGASTDVVEIAIENGGAQLITSGPIHRAARDAGDRYVVATSEEIQVLGPTGSVTRTYSGTDFALAPTGLDLAVTDESRIAVGRLGGELRQIADWPGYRVSEPRWSPSLFAVSYLRHGDAPLPELVVTTLEGESEIVASDVGQRHFATWQGLVFTQVVEGELEVLTAPLFDWQD